MTDTPVHIDFAENGDWTAIISDPNGKAVISFSYHVTAVAGKAGGAGGAYAAPAKEDYHGKRVVTPKRPAQLEAEALKEWEDKTLTEQGVKPYEHN
jgi:hypothetical protein